MPRGWVPPSSSFLTSLSGVTSLVAAVPAGIISDRVGGVPALLGGLASFVTLFAAGPRDAVFPVVCCSARVERGLFRNRRSAPARPGRHGWCVGATVGHRGRGGPMDSRA